MRVETALLLYITMNLFKQQHNTSGYNTIPDTIANDETAAVPLGTTILPTPTTTMMTATKDHRLSKRMMIAIVTGMMMLLVVAGGTVWRRYGETTVEGLVVATQDSTEEETYDDYDYDDAIYGYIWWGQ